MPSTLCKMSDGGDRIFIRLLNLPYVRHAFVSANSVKPHPQGGVKTAALEMTLVIGPKELTAPPASFSEIVEGLFALPCITSIRMAPTTIRLKADGKTEYVRPRLVVGLTDDHCAKCNNISCDVTENNNDAKGRRKRK